MENKAYVRFDRHKIINLALATLCQQIEALGAEPIVPRVHVRLALSVLYGLSDRDRRCFLEFWNVLTHKTLGQKREVGRAYLRSSVARTQLMGIARACGVEMGDPGMSASLQRLWQEPNGGTSDDGG